MKRCCEYCKHCDEDYETICVFCRVDGGKVDFSKFELTDELAELERKAQMYDELLASMLPAVEQLKERERLAKIGSATEKAFESGFSINQMHSVLSKIDYCMYDKESLLNWVESENE